MTRTRQIAIAFAAGRGAFGGGLIGSPARLASGWIGADAGRRPSQVAIRALGARDMALAGGTVAAALAGRARIGTVALGGLSALAGAILTAVVAE